ncbi:MAG: ABC transporter substrate-binding protein [Deltaproteobacteria bacterium]|nr:ABC transporter substrate-binding protein [Deltaproteobacteria bacterium]
MMFRAQTLLAPLAVAVLCLELFFATSARSETILRSEALAPIRVAALLPWAADAVSVAGDGAKLVAGVRRSLHEPLPAGLVDLGNPHSPSLERLVEVHPDLVVADRAIHARLTPQIEKLGVKVLLLGTDSVAETLASLDSLSAAIGRPAPLEARIADVRARIGALAGRSDASVVALFGAPGSFYVMTERAWLGDLARHVGLDLAIAPSGDEAFRAGRRLGRRGDGASRSRPARRPASEPDPRGSRAPDRRRRCLVRARRGAPRHPRPRPGSLQRQSRPRDREGR